MTVKAARNWEPACWTGRSARCRGLTKGVEVRAPERITSLPQFGKPCMVGTTGGKP